ncbi:MULTISPECIES: hypothetical protein [Aquimarina]|uniref:hypothetical protein n=1 Tax=Aquimarina TaxID=290174 RepID=UPI000467DCE5|nr:MULTISPECIES: hypothetical protein [Aquimarina]
MKKLMFRSHYLVLFPMILGLLLISSCEKEDTDNEPVEIVDTKEVSEKSFPLDPDLREPNIPRPGYNAPCVVRLSYLSFLRRCPENSGVMNYWINILNSQGFDDMTKGFVTSNEASVKWNSQYNSYLSRNGLSSNQVDKLIYITYRGMLLREPDVTGGMGWTNLLYDKGLKKVLNGVANSQEFRNRLANISTECTNAANQCTY